VIALPHENALLRITVAVAMFFGPAWVDLLTPHARPRPPDLALARHFDSFCCLLSHATRHCMAASLREVFPCALRLSDLAFLTITFETEFAPAPCHTGCRVYARRVRATRVIRIAFVHVFAFLAIATVASIASAARFVICVIACACRKWTAGLLPRVADVNFSALRDAVALEAFSTSTLMQARAHKYACAVLVARAFRCLLTHIDSRASCAVPFIALVALAAVDAQALV